MPEQKNRPSEPLDQATLEAFMCLFFPRLDIYAEQLATGRYVYRQQPVTLPLIKDHLQGDITLGTYALTQDSQAQWIAIDADQEMFWQQLLAFVVTSDLPIYLEQSRRGGHVWLFFAERVSGVTARRFAKSVLTQAGLGESKIEVYPKQNEVAAGAPGSLIRAPFGFHRLVHVPGKPGKRYAFLNPDGTPLAPTIREQLILVVSAKRVPLRVIETLAAEVPEKRPTIHQTEKRFSVRKGIDQQMPLSERIKAAISVREFISHYVELDERGRGKCPFHDDQEPSFGVNDTGNYWSCYAQCCDPPGGSIIDFWSHYREQVLHQDGSFRETIKDLANLLGL